MSNKPVIVMTHGWNDSKETFELLIKRLKNNYRCIALDLPNFGVSEQTAKIITIDDYAKFIASFLQKLEIKKYFLLGHSMGGQIAIYGVGKDILRPDKLILLASAGVRNNKLISKQLFKYTAKITKHLLPSNAKDKFYKRIGSDYETSLSSVHKKIIASVLGCDVQVQASQIHIPALLIYGNEDKHTPAWMGERLHELINNSKLEIILDQDHWLHQKSTPEVADNIEKFIK